MNHLHEDKEGIHSCKGERIDERNPDTYVVWTKCEKDVPANTSFKSSTEVVSCVKCIRKEADHE
jgi:hypothetical protein